MQVGSLVKFVVGAGDGGEWIGIVTKMWGTDACPMYEVYWSEEDGVGLYFDDDLEAVCE